MDPVIPLSAAFSNLSLRSGPEPCQHFPQHEKSLAYLNDNETSSKTGEYGGSQEQSTHEGPMDTSGLEENTIFESSRCSTNFKLKPRSPWVEIEVDISPQSVAQGSEMDLLLNTAKRGEKRKKNFNHKRYSRKIPRIQVNTANIERLQKGFGMQKASKQRYSISPCKPRRVPYDFLRHERDFIFSRRLRVANLKTKRREDKAYELQVELCRKDSSSRFSHTDLCSSTKDTAIRFGAFSCLPTELRLMILEYARPDPRIVRLLKSKHSSALYSKTSIPGLLHATRESRTIALKWYQLCFPMRYPRLSLTDWMRPDKLDLIKPRTYFDFTNDVLYIGCKSCYSVSCDACQDNVSFLQDRIKVERVILHNTIPTVFQTLTPPRLFYDRTPFLAVASLLGGVTGTSSLREVMILGPENRALKPQTGLSHLKESSQKFDWQDGEDLMTQYTAYKNRRSPGLRGCFTVKRFRRMELDITPEATKIYGFMGDRFSGMTFNLSYKKGLGQ